MTWTDREKQAIGALGLQVRQDRVTEHGIVHDPRLEQPLEFLTIGHARSYVQGRADEYRLGLQDAEADRYVPDDGDDLEYPLAREAEELGKELGLEPWRKGYPATFGVTLPTGREVTFSDLLTLVQFLRDFKETRESRPEIPYAALLEASQLAADRDMHVVLLPDGRIKILPVQEPGQSLAHPGLVVAETPQEAVDRLRPQEQHEPINELYVEAQAAELGVHVYRGANRPWEVKDKTGTFGFADLEQTSAFLHGLAVARLGRPNRP